MTDDNKPSPLNPSDYRVGPPQTEWLIVPAVQDPNLETFKATLKPNGLLEFSALPVGRDISSGVWYAVTDPNRVQFLQKLFEQHRRNRDMNLGQTHVPVALPEEDPNCSAVLRLDYAAFPKTCPVHGLAGCPTPAQILAARFQRSLRC